MTAPTPYSHEREFNGVPERCNAERVAPVLEANPMRDGFMGTPGQFTVYCREKIAHAAGLLSLNVLGAGNRLAGATRH